MRKALFLAVIVALMACGAAIAADKIGTFGAPNASGTYPMEVTDNRAITVASDATFTSAGAVVMGAFTSSSGEIDGGLVLDGTIYTAKLMVDGAIYAGTSTVDPCATLGSNAWLFFNPAGALCICKAGVAKNTIDGTTNCY